MVNVSNKPYMDAMGDDFTAKSCAIGQQTLCVFWKTTDQIDRMVTVQVSLFLYFCISHHML